MTNQHRHKILLLSLPAPFAPDTPLFPLGIGYLAAAMQLDRPVRSVHYRQFEDVRKEIPKLIEDWQPEIVGMTCNTFNRGAVKRVCQWLRVAYPDIKVIVGGVHASFMYEQILRDFGANFVVIGEGELTLPELCTACEAGTSPHDINGIAFLEGDQLIVTPRREPVADLDELAVPDYSFAAELMRSTGMGFLISSRGCPVQCTFCSTSSYWGQRVRTNSPKRIVDEMELLISNYGVKRIFFHDDTFNLGLNRVRQICHEIANRGLQIEWGVSCRVTPVSEEMLDLMVSSGCRHICWGIESGSEKILTGINKKISLQQIRQAFELCQKHIGTISVGAFVMVGNPGESEETIKETVEFLDSLPMTDPPSTSLLYILPGTALYSTLPQMLPAIESYWTDCDEVPLYTLEQSVETLVSWHELVSSSGKLIPFEGKQHFWSGIHMNQQEEPPPSELDRIIQPEIRDDELYRLITELTMQPDITTVLEIGSSAGGGSTEAFVSGLKNNPAAPQLFCMEVSRPRYTALYERYQDESFVHCYNVSSVPISCFPSEREVVVFYNFIPTALNQYPLTQVLGWLRQDIDYIRKTDAPQNGIELIKQQHDIANFSMVLIDGSEFLGKAELDAVYGATFILLDDVNGFKNYHNRKRLLDDPAYELIRENLELRNGYSVFRKKGHPPLPVHFFTIVLNGEPFIRHHIDAFKKLPFAWHWHIVEGVADLVHDTAWSLPNGGRITEELHRGGLSNDGTSDYLDELAAQYPEQITIYRKPTGQFWNGKLEMVNAPLPNLPAECLLWQVDSDEFWSCEQIKRVHEMFEIDRDRTAAHFICNFYVGPGLAISTMDTYGNNTLYEWYRCWLYKSGDSWISHEPPRLGRSLPGSLEPTDISHINPFTHLETARQGLVFDHLAYVSAKQLRFKQTYYGYANAVSGWNRLQQETRFPALLRDYFPWVHDDALVVQTPLLTTGNTNIIYLRTDAIGDSILSAGMLPHIKQRYPGSTLTVVCQDRTAPLYDACPAVDAVIPFDLIRLFTMPDYRTLVIGKINRTRPDLILNPIYSHDLHDEFLVHHIQAPLKVTIEGDCSNRSSEKLNEMRDLYSRVIANNPNDRTELDHNRTFLQAVGIDAPPLMPQVWISPQDQQWADSTMHELGMAHGTAIILFPGALLDYKTYPHYQQVLAGLSNYPLIVCGGVELQQQADQLCRVHGGQSANLAGQTTLGQLAALMQRARLYLGSDSSGFHIACAVGLRNVVMLGGGHFGRFCPYSALTTVVCLPLACYRCNWHCPHQRVHCLHDIRPATVLQAVRYSLNDQSARTEPVFFPQLDSPAAESPLLAPDLLIGRLKVSGETNRIAER